MMLGSSFGLEDIVVILDDDELIHEAWDAQLAPILTKHRNIQIRHLEQGSQVLEFIRSLSSTDKQRILLLTDYELLKQDLNGLQIIEHAQVKRAVLVTSHYGNVKIREQAVNAGARILPKQLVSEVVIKLVAGF